MLDCVLERIFDMNSSAASNMDEIKELDNNIYLVRKRLLNYLNANILASSDLYKKIPKVVDEFLGVADRYRLGRIEYQNYFLDYGGKNSWTIHLENMERLERKLERDGQIEHAIEIKNIGDDIRLRAIRSLEIDEYLFKWMTTRVSHLLLRDLLVICNFYKLPVSFSREIYNLDLSGAFFVFKEVFEFCEFGAPNFRWQKYVNSRALSLDGFLRSRIDEINKVPLRESLLFSPRGAEIFGLIGREFGGVVNGLTCSERSEYPDFRRLLPNFKPWNI
jgi:hypothetical protein